MKLDIIQKWDEEILYLINKHCKNRILDKVMPFVTALGNLGMIWIILAILMMRKADYRKIGIIVLVTLAFTTFMGEGIIKHIVKRKRPFIGKKNKELLIKEPSSFSFPSGHTASSFAVAVVFLKSNSNISTVIVLIALSIAFSRLYLKVHYPSDVIGGIILGLICGGIIFNYLYI